VEESTRPSPGLHRRPSHDVAIVLKPGMSVSYWAGFAWNRAGKFTSAGAWKRYVDEFAEGLGSPIMVKVSP